MKDPASAVALSDTAVLGAHLPGIPDGVGEIQVFVHQGDKSRRGSMLEVVAMELGRRAVTRHLSDPWPAGGQLPILPSGLDACRLTQSFWALLPTGICRRDARAIQTAYRHSLRDLVGVTEEHAADDRLWPARASSSDIRAG